MKNMNFVNEEIWTYENMINEQSKNQLFAQTSRFGRRSTLLSVLAIIEHVKHLRASFVCWVVVFDIFIKFR